MVLCSPATLYAFVLFETGGAKCVQQCRGGGITCHATFVISGLWQRAFVQGVPRSSLIYSGLHRQRDRIAQRVLRPQAQGLDDLGPRLHHVRRGPGHRRSLRLSLRRRAHVLALLRHLCELAVEDVARHRSGLVTEAEDEVDWVVQRARPWCDRLPHVLPLCPSPDGAVFAPGVAMGRIEFGGLARNLVQVSLREVCAYRDVN